MKKNNKSFIGVLVLIVISLIFIGLLLWNTFKEDENTTTEVYESKQLELYSAAMYDDLEEVEGMEYNEARDYIITRINDNRETYSSDSVDLASLKLLNVVTNDESGTTSGLLENLDLELGELDVNDLLAGIFGSESNSIKKTLTIRSNTVCQTVTDSKYCVDKLNANVYVTDDNSDKWVVLVHPFMTSGSLIYNSIGGMYEKQGYNIVAPDLRGFGDSDGSVAMGYLESLDIYDWIKDLNANWNSRYDVNAAPKTIVVHGISLGGATTLQLATNPDVASANGNEPYTKNLIELNVKGFVDDCGYTSMSGIIKGMLTGGDAIQLSSLFETLGIDKVEFMSKLQNILDKYNIGGFDDYDFDDLLSSSNYQDYYKYFEMFSEQFGDVDEAIDNYISGDNKYEKPIPGIDEETWNYLEDKYGKYFNEYNYNDRVTNFLPTNSIGSVNPTFINNTSIIDENVLDGIIGEVLMSLVGVGLTEENYDKYSNVFSNGRKFPSGSKVVIIHGTADTTVPHSNADIIASNMAPAILLHKWDAAGMPHAFVVIGSSKSEYTNLITNFTNCVSNSNCKSISR